MEEYKKRYEEWLQSSVFDKDVKQELLSIKMNEKEIEDRFYKNLEFGTGGLRAVIGAGTNRLNNYTVRRITKGYGNFLLEEYGKEACEKGVVIAYDVRYYSKEFSIEVASTLASMGIKTFIFQKVTTTPELSFSIPFLNAIGGVVITASHNPANYNGYKIYDKTGCQLTPSLANKVIDEINQINDYSSYYDECKHSSLIIQLNSNVDTAFEEKALEQMIHPEVVGQVADKFKILYTPLHGTGKRPIFNVLKKAGFKKIYTVIEQLDEDPEFRTVKSPNPEEEEAFTLALIVAKQNDVDIILGSDPDGDRVGLLVKHQGSYKSLNGNQIGSLLINYITESNKEKILEMSNPYIVNTIVTSNLGVMIAKNHHIKSYSTLTGFKYIGEKITELQENEEFLMGYEESYGFLVGEHARDKDSVATTLLISEMSAYYALKNKTLIDVLEEIYIEYGYYKEELVSQVFEGQSGAKKIKALMKQFRDISNNAKLKYGIRSIEDYAEGIKQLPKADVLKIIFNNDAWIAVRPSGTEPKIKYYLGSVGKTEINATKRMEALKKFLREFNY